MYGKQRGMALLLVLCTIALISLLAQHILTKTGLLISLEQNELQKTHQRWTLLGAEAIAIQRLSSAITNNKNIVEGGAWQISDMQIMKNGPEAKWLVRDRNNCFNINALFNAGSVPQKKNSNNENNKSSPPSLSQSLQTRTFSDKPYSIQVFYNLLINLGVNNEQAKNIMLSIKNWQPKLNKPTGVKYNQQNNEYGAVTSSQTNNKTIMVDVSQLRDIQLIDSSIFNLLRTQACIRDDKNLSVNINTLSPQEAPLMAALLLNKISTQQAEMALNNRPKSGWVTLSDFLKQIKIEKINIPDNILTQQSNHFEIMLWLPLKNGSYPLLVTKLKIVNGKVQILQRNFGWGE